MQDWVLRLGRNLQSAVKKGTKTSVIKMVYLKRTINLLHNMIIHPKIGLNTHKKTLV